MLPRWIVNADLGRYPTSGMRHKDRAQQVLALAPALGNLLHISPLANFRQEFAHSKW